MRDFGGPLTVLVATPALRSGLCAEIWSAGSLVGGLTMGRAGRPMVRVARRTGSAGGVEDVVRALLEVAFLQPGGGETVVHRGGAGPVQVRARDFGRNAGRAAEPGRELRPVQR